MRYFLRARVAAVIAAAVWLGSANAGDNDTITANCATCEKGRSFLGHPKEMSSKPICDSKIFPLHDSKYSKQFCGPQICPNACFGYFPTAWRSWDAACGAPHVAPAAVVPPAPVPAPAPAVVAPPPTPIKPADKNPLPVPMNLPEAEKPQAANPGSVLGIPIDPPKITEPAKPATPPTPTPKIPKHDQSPVSIPTLPESGLIAVPAPPTNAPGVLLFGTVPSSMNIDPKR